jgi:aryl-alcohol dehydrogenase-like predicted oxidoreductase
MHKLIAARADCRMTSGSMHPASRAKTSQRCAQFIMSVIAHLVPLSAPYLQSAVTGAAVRCGHLPPAHSVPALSSACVRDLQNIELVQKVEGIAKKYDATAGQVALAWLHAQVQ